MQIRPIPLDTHITENIVNCRTCVYLSYSIRQLGQNHLNVTIGSALDLFGGEMEYDKTMDEIEILAKLHLTEDEKEKSRQDLQQMLDYVDMLNQLDTSDVEPLTHIFPIKNVFREDVVLESTPKEELLKNAPKEKDGQFLVPKTIG